MLRAWIWMKKGENSLYHVGLQKMFDGRFPKTVFCGKVVQGDWCVWLHIAIAIVEGEFPAAGATKETWVLLKTDLTV
jgi:hypothetical protein